MANEDIFAALADPSRRAILEKLRAGPAAVGQLAAEMPISRPAVSQHLKVLVSAGFLDATTQGTRRLYRLNHTGATQLRSYADGLWDDALSQFAHHAGQETPMPEDSLAPIVKTLFVPVRPVEAFRIFTEDLEAWWPVESHSLSAATDALPRRVVVTKEAVVETKSDGTTGLWGKVTAWEPGMRFAMDWHVGRPADEATFLDVRFEARGDGTRVTLIHDGFDILAGEGPQMRTRYNGGWDLVLGQCFAGACSGHVTAAAP